MKNSRLLLRTCAALTLASAPLHAFTPGDLVISLSGDGSTALVNTGNALTLREYTPAGATVGGLINTNLLLSGTAGSEGALALSPDGSLLTVAGYSTASTGTGALSGRTDANAPRQINTINVATNAVGTPVAVQAFSSNNIRGAVTAGANTYLAGGTTGTLLYSGSLPTTTIQSTSTNTRVVAVQNGNLYFTTGAGTVGLYGFSGTPATATAATPILTGVTGQGTNPFDFAFSPSGTALYVADSTAGIQKFTLSGGTWSLAYNITTATTGLTGLAVDFSGANPILYAVNPTNLYSFTDLGATGAMTSIATAGTNTAFRGLEAIPTPEPATLGTILFGSGLLMLRRRHRLA